MIAWSTLYMYIVKYLLREVPLLTFNKLFNLVFCEGIIVSRTLRSSCAYVISRPTIVFWLVRILWNFGKIKSIQILEKKKRNKSLTRLCSLFCKTAVCLWSNENE